VCDSDCGVEETEVIAGGGKRRNAEGSVDGRGGYTQRGQGPTTTMVGIHETTTQTNYEPESMRNAS
jgi:hypothetical protein